MCTGFNAAPLESILTLHGIAEGRVLLYGDDNRNRADAQFGQHDICVSVAETVPTPAPHRGTMNKVVILGRGGAGKSVLAVRLGAATGLPVVELDKHFWSTDLTPTPTGCWVAIQRELVLPGGWILDGDLGPDDVLDVRLGAADTVIILDFPLWRCVWRAARRSREGLAFWRWLINYRRHHLPVVLAAVGDHAHGADVFVLRGPREVDHFLSEASRAT